MADTDNKQVSKPIFQVGFSARQGGEVSFLDVNELISWLQRELAFWTWMESPPQGTNGQVVNVTQQFRNTLNELRQSLTRYATKPQADVDTHRFQSLLNSWSSSGFVHSGSFDAQILSTINDKYGSLAAYAVWLHIHFEFLTRQYHPNNLLEVIPLHRPDVFRGVAVYHALSQGMIVESNHDLIKTFERTHRDAVSKLDSLNTKSSQTIEELERIKEETQKSLTVLKRFGRLKWRGFVNDSRSQVNDEMKRMHDIQRAYTEHMNIKAPVAYWQEKSAEHSINAENVKRKLFLYIPSSSLALAGLVFIGWGVLISDDKSSYAAFIIFMLVSTAMFWAARILVRLYLSELHLSIDAKERAVMAKTYLALINENKVESTDRALVLAALFRPTADGLVKDDAAPITGPASILSGRLSS